MPVTLPQGTKEYLIVDLTDLLGTVVTLDGLGTTYDVKDINGNLKYAAALAVTTAMRARCMIDTEQGGTWQAGNYRLYLEFNAAPELPRIGPFTFTVDDS
jgi:hypothetical protein